MKKNKLFSPRAFRKMEGIENFRVLSKGYFTVAQELRDKSKGDSGHHYVLPSVIMYVSSLEAFFSEYLALCFFSNKNNERLAKLKEEDDFKKRITGIFTSSNRGEEELDLGGELFQNLFALKELRNSAIHYNPYFIEHTDWPKSLRQVLNKTKIEVINSGWAGNMSRPEIADWAYETIKGVIEEFSNISGWENPFTGEYPEGWEAHRP